MRSSIFVAAVLCVAASTTFAQPVVTGVLNNASYMLPGLPNAAIAQGSVFAIFGTGLGPAALAQQPSYPLQKVLGGTAVKVTAGGKDYDAIPIYTVASQVGAIMPSTVPAGAAKLTVTFGGQTSAPFDVTVGERAPGVFTANSKGSGPVAALLNGAGYVTPSTPAKAGDVVTIYATGFGAITSDETATPPLGAVPGANVEVWIGGVKASNIQYAGRAPGLAGFDQVNFVVPGGVTPGCYVSLYVKAGSVVSNGVTIPTASGPGACGDANGITSDDVQRIASKPGANIGSVFLTRIQPSVPLFGGLVTVQVPLDGVAAGFGTYTPSLAASMQSPLRVPSVGSCVTNTFTGNGTNGIPSDPVRAPGADAGTLTVTGAKGTQQVQADPTGYYYNLLSGNTDANPLGTPFFEPGNAAATNGNGGAVVKAFSTSFTVPASPLTWTNKDAVTQVQRGQDVTVTWSGADPKSVVVVAGFSTDREIAGAAFFCAAPAAAGTFTIPGVVTSTLPASALANGAILPPGYVLVGTSTSQRINAQGLDVGLTSFLFLQGQPVTYK